MNKEHIMDLTIDIINGLVTDGLIQDYTTTGNETVFKFQDIISYEIEQYFNK